MSTPIENLGSGFHRRERQMTPQVQNLPQFVRDLLASPPRRGEGLNLWFYRVSRVLHPYRAPAEIIELLSAATTGEPVREEDLRKQRIAIQIVRDVLDETFQYFQRVPARLRRVRAP